MTTRRLDRSGRNVVIVHVIGLPGAGKSTLTARLGPSLGWPVLSIGTFREGRSPDWKGEAEAWDALCQAIEGHGCSEVVLETSGLNGRLSRVREIVTDDEILRVKLVCPREILHRRVRERDAGEEPSPWAYSQTIPDRHVFIDRFYEIFEDLTAEIAVDTSEHDPSEILALVERELGSAEEDPDRGEGVGGER